MVRLSPFKAVLALAVGITLGTATPVIIPVPALAEPSFSDVASGDWAAPFVKELADRDIIKGFPDGTFHPNDPVTRTQFAAMLRKAFANAQPVRSPINFTDVASDYWGYTAIQDAYTSGFLTGYPGNRFRPNENIPRAQVLVSLANGLRYATSAESPETVLQTYRDAPEIPPYARNSIAAATERQIVVNYPDVRLLNANRSATRAEVAAFLYQALVSNKQLSAIQSPYIVGKPVSKRPTEGGDNQVLQIPAGTEIPVRYDRADKILLAKNEPNPSPLTLTVSKNLVNSDGKVLIQAGSQIAGELVVTNGAAQFKAAQLTLANAQKIKIKATSDRISETEEVRRGVSTDSVLKGTVLGAGAAAGVAAVTGDRKIRVGEILIGAGAGAVAGAVLNRDRVELIVIRPDTDLTLQLVADLILPQ